VLYDCWHIGTVSNKHVFAGMVACLNVLALVMVIGKEVSCLHGCLYDT